MPDLDPKHPIASDLNALLEKLQAHLITSYKHQKDDWWEFHTDETEREEIYDLLAARYQYDKNKLDELTTQLHEFVIMPLIDMATPQQQKKIAPNAQTDTQIDNTINGWLKRVTAAAGKAKADECLDTYGASSASDITSQQAPQFISLCKLTISSVKTKPKSRKKK